jgi:hypothetical protein
MVSITMTHIYPRPDRTIGDALILCRAHAIELGRIAR